MNYEDLEVRASDNPGDNKTWRIQLSAPVRVNGRTIHSMTGRFLSDKGRLLFGRRVGVAVRDLAPYVESITEIAASRRPKTRAEAEQAAARRILHLCHPNAWDDFRAKLERGDYSSLANSNLNFRDVTQYLSDAARGWLQAAFEVKGAYSWSHPSAHNRFGRDLSIQTKLCEDGIFRAWFRSEFPGCGNGQYYLLISPTWAVHCEDD